MRRAMWAPLLMATLALSWSGAAFAVYPEDTAGDEFYEPGVSVSTRAGEKGGCEPGGANALLFVAVPLAVLWGGRRSWR